MSKELQAELQCLVQERYALRAQMANIGSSMSSGYRWGLLLVSYGARVLYVRASFQRNWGIFFYLG